MDGYGLPDCLRATVCNAKIMERITNVLKVVMT
jgi:hypothetical protein